jgi:hypothetical protein
MLCKNGNSISAIQRVWDYPKIQKQSVSAVSRNALFFQCGYSQDLLAALQVNPDRLTPFIASVSTLAVLALPQTIALTRTFVLVIIGLRD